MALHLKKLGSSRSYREESGEFLCDGIKLLEDAVNSGARITAVIASTQIPFPLSVDTRVFFADRDLIDSLSPLKNAQNILFSCKIPSFGVLFETETRSSIDKTGVHILLDEVQDPSNVGAIIRTANALRVKSVIMTGGCADPYNPKAVRASMGAIFRQMIYPMSFSELQQQRGAGARFIAAMPGEGSRDITAIELKDAIICIGSEGKGLSENVLSLCDERVTIPLAPGSESLNAAAAAAIIIWEATKPGSYNK